MRKLGQHFLKNKEVLETIVETLDVRVGDTIIEIGPGHGELTEVMIEQLKDRKIERLILIEKDKELVKELRIKLDTQWRDYGDTIEIIEGDVLKILPKLPATSYKLVGNIPYYITGYLFRILGELEHKPRAIVLLIQKEVAERVAAVAPGMNLLAASVQIWAKPTVVCYVGRKDFDPSPKVESAVLQLTTDDRLRTTAEERDRYYAFIKILFKQPRKTILNNLRDANLLIHANAAKIEDILKKLGIRPTGRGQDLTIEQIRALAQQF